MLHYFKKMETHWRGAGPYHGGDGPLAVTPMRGAGLMDEVFAQTAAAAGIPYCEDSNGADQEGFGLSDHRTRASPEHGATYPRKRGAGLT